MEALESRLTAIHAWVPLTLLQERSSVIPCDSLRLPDTFADVKRVYTHYIVHLNDVAATVVKSREEVLSIQ